ncbi:hypothetical protein HII31_03464 [Pseudocercospora fuligena]|uniref:Nucleotide-diphospho-sugar transferase domain-containing protein n=1 Tax=Pseudocercospora fuligena TaxID=685502 RepID=A0A8H6RQ37_9PEZI|nr:hypothetical protein HII31_03464 [Pseudocercospora fuligena]
MLSHLRWSRRLTLVRIGLVFALIAIGGLITKPGISWLLKAPSEAVRPLVSGITPPQSAFSRDEALFLQQYMAHLVRTSTRVNSNYYSMFGVFNWTIPGISSWTEPLREQLCIIDLDDRPLDEPGQIWGNTVMNWDSPDEVHGISLGFLNHWLYAKIHGYKYYSVHVDTYTDRHSSWKKPSIISAILKRHKTCVYIDSDAIFNHLDLPMEWLMNYWSLDPRNTPLALASDPDAAFNQDIFGKVNLNTGFIVAQKGLRTFEIMDAWRDCPEENGRHPECVKFREKVPGHVTDQGGFSTYIRYDYPDDIMELPCSENNGYPESGTECYGEFITHLWKGKRDWIKIAVGRQMPGELLEFFHRWFLAEKSIFRFPERNVLAQALHEKRSSL